jgi:hypothetical protein
MKGSAKDLTDLILWCRRNGIAWSTLTCGAITIDGADTRAVDTMDRTVHAIEPRPSMAQRYGGAMLDGSGTPRGEMTWVVELEDGD